MGSGLKRSLFPSAIQGGLDKGEPLCNKIEFFASFPTDSYPPIEHFFVKMGENRFGKEVLQAFVPQLKATQTECLELREILLSMTLISL